MIAVAIGNPTEVFTATRASLAAEVNRAVKMPAGAKSAICRGCTIRRDHKG